MVTAGWREEVEELLDELGLALEAYFEAEGGSAAARHQLDSAFRYAHSCKGLLRLAEREAAATVAHALEDLLDGLRSGRLTLCPIVADGLMTGQELLRRFLAPAPGDESSGSGATDFRRQVQTLLSREPVGNPVPTARLRLDPDLEQRLNAAEHFRLQQLAGQGGEMYEIRWIPGPEGVAAGIDGILGSLASMGEVVSTVPDTDAAGALLLRFLFAGRLPLDAQLLCGGDQLGTVTVHPLVTQDTLPPDPVPASAPSVRVDVARLDRLMDRVGELLWLRGDLAALDQRLRLRCPPEERQVLHQLNHRLERILGRLRQEALDLRMVAIRPLLERMRQVARRAALDRNKLVRLEVEDEGIRLDKRLAEELAEPLMHLVRNAVDHGIEAPDIRRLSSKPEEGCIRLSARRQGQQIVLRVSDDGGGMDRPALRRQAEERGLIKTTEPLADEELLALSFLPGISRCDAADAGAGRGVGLDVVQNRLGRIAGRVRIDSSHAGGTQFTLTLPATLSLLSALLCRSGTLQFALPAATVRQLARIGDRQLAPDDVPQVGLERLFGAEAAARQPTRLLEVVMGDERILLPVDEVSGQIEVLVRPLGPLLACLPGLSGLAVCGDQRLEPLLDPAALLRLAAAGQGATVAPAMTEVPLPSAAEPENSRRRPWLIFTSVADLSRLALPVDQVLELLPCRPLLPLPGAPAVLAGVLLQHGDVLPVFDPGLLLGEGKGLDKNARSIIVCQHSCLRFGLLAHGIQRLAALDGPIAPAVLGGATDCLLGCVQGAEYAVYLVNLGKFLQHVLHAFVSAGGRRGQEKGADRRG